MEVPNVRSGEWQRTCRRQAFNFQQTFFSGLPFTPLRVRGNFTITGRSS